MRPTTPWNYGLVLDPAAAPAAVKVRELPLGDFPFSPMGAPVELTVTGRRVPEWTLVNGSAGPLAAEPCDQQPARREPHADPVRLREAARDSVPEDRRRQGRMTGVAR